MLLDLQLLTCTRFRSPHFAGMHGAVLDVGCGEMPLRGLLPPGTNYTGLDIPQADGFGMRRHLEIEDFDGLHGTLLATVPFSARVHHAPHDYYRFTRFGIARMFGSFGSVEVSERGDDLAVIANKRLVVCVRIARPSWALVWRVPLLALAGPVALPALCIAHLSLWCSRSSNADRLGYDIHARKA